LSLGISEFKYNVPALDVAEITQSLTEGLPKVGKRGPRGPQAAYSSNFPSLLALGGKRRGEETAGHGTEECPTFHYSITSSAPPPPARPSSDGGIVSPERFGGLAVASLRPRREVFSIDERTRRSGSRIGRQ